MLNFANDIQWTYFVLITFIFPQAVARNFATIIVTRIITGGASAVLGNITGGIVSDIWRDGKSKSFGISLYIFGLLSGTSMGKGLSSPR